MSSDTLRVVAIGAVALLLLRRQSAYTAKRTQAAITKRTDAVVIGTNVAAGIASLFGTKSGQAAVGRAASTVSGWFAPSTAATPAMDWDVFRWGDDSTTGAVVDPADYAVMDQLD